LPNLNVNRCWFVFPKLYSTQRNVIYGSCVIYTDRQTELHITVFKMSCDGAKF